MTNLKKRQIFALGISMLGVLLLVIALFPIARYLSTAKQKFPDLISPLDNQETRAGLKDYTRASNWFIVDQVNYKEPEKIEYYTVSIPALNINKASTAIGGEDLSKSLVHFPGTALPGKKGNSVIFGHSILPIFYNPKDYLSIFSTLPELEKGDEIFVEYDGISYKYIVETMFEVKPTDIEILDQDKSSASLSLVTCTPPGDPRKPKRLVVRAKLARNVYADQNSGS